MRMFCCNSSIKSPFVWYLCNFYFYVFFYTVLQLTQHKLFVYMHVHRCASVRVFFGMFLFLLPFFKLIPLFLFSLFNVFLSWFLFFCLGVLDCCVCVYTCVCLCVCECVGVHLFIYLFFLLVFFFSLVFVACVYVVCLLAAWIVWRVYVC
jgi:hypothetical protein